MQNLGAKLKMQKYTRRTINRFSLAAIGSLMFKSIPATGQKRSTSNPVPIILDTDIGDDIDDTWALMMLLRSPRVATKLITTDFGNTKYRTRLLAKLLQKIDSANVPIGLGLDPSDKPGNQSEWLGDYQLGNYQGAIYEDGVEALIETIKSSSERVTLLCIGPATNIAEALRRDPSIAENARFVGMHGSIKRGYDGEEGPAKEWNVKVDPKSLQKVFDAPWECTIAPLDTCGLIKLKGKRYQKIFNNNDPWIRALIDNYKAWLPKADWLEPKPNFNTASSTLFDTLAVHLTYSEKFLVMEDLRIRVTDEGYTVLDEKNGRVVRCALGWEDQSAFEDELVRILTNRLG